MLDEERMRPGRWLGTVLCVPYSALTLLVLWQEGHPAHKNLCHLSTVLFHSKWMKNVQFTWKMAINTLTVRDVCRRLSFNMLHMQGMSLAIGRQTSVPQDLLKV